MIISTATLRSQPPENKIHVASGKKILLVDDNEVNQEVVRMMLENLGFVAHIAANGREALNAVETKEYDAILMDCMMPVMDGYEATGEIRRKQLEDGLGYTPIIAMTANAIEGDREKCLAAGMDDYLSKPFQSQTLLTVLSKWLAIEVGVTQVDEPTAAREENLPVINQNTIKSLMAFENAGNPGFFSRIIELYTVNADQTLRKLEQAYSANDAWVIFQAAHALKSSSQQIGADSFAELCRIIETDARSGSFDASGRTLSNLKQQFAYTCKNLQSFMTDPVQI